SADEGGDQLVPHTLDVHSRPRGEVADQLVALSRADGRPTAAAGHRLALGLDQWRPTDGARFGHAEDPLVAAAPTDDRSDYLGDHLAGPLDDDHVADADVLPSDVL